jgi:hypothetical protein
MNQWGYQPTSDNVERRRMMYARARAHYLRAWIFRNFTLVDKEGNPVDPEHGFYFPYFSQQAKALMNYRKTALEYGLRPRFEDPKVTATENSAETKTETKRKPKGKGKVVNEANEADEKFKKSKRLIENALKSSLDLWTIYQKKSKPEPSTFAYLGPRLDVRQVSGEATPSSGMSFDDFLFMNYDPIYLSHSEWAIDTPYTTGFHQDDIDTLKPGSYNI